jgi:hypothetical protein
MLTTPELTLFAVPKPFRGHVAVTQRNAVTSWTLLHPRPQIILFGDEEGIAETCQDLCVQHVANLARNEFGTPLASDVFRQAQGLSSAGVLCFVNSDIMLMRDLSKAVDQVRTRFRRFLMSGERRDVDIAAPWDFGSDQWEKELREHALKHGRSHGRGAMDYFVFTNGALDPVPDLTVGRAGIDNWFIYQARKRKVPVVDASKAVLVLHQNHDYWHHPLGRQGTHFGEEARRNLESSHGYQFFLGDRTHYLTARGPQLDLSWERLAQHWARLPVLAPRGLRGGAFRIGRLLRGLVRHSAGPAESGRPTRRF